MACILEWCQRRPRTILAITVLSAMAMGVWLITEGASIIHYYPNLSNEMWNHWSSLRNNHVFYFAFLCLIFGVLLLLKTICGGLSIGDQGKFYFVHLFWFYTLVSIAAAVILSIYLSVNIKRFRGEIKLSWNASLETYYSNMESENLIDFVQQSFKCCGLRNRTDWTLIPHNGSRTNIPSSCCYDEVCGNTTTFSKGCYEMFDNFVRKRTILYSATIPPFTIIEIFGLFACSVIICCPPNQGYDDIVEESS